MLPISGKNTAISKEIILVVSVLLDFVINTVVITKRILYDTRKNDIRFDEISISIKNLFVLEKL